VLVDAILTLSSVLRAGPVRCVGVGVLLMYSVAMIHRMCAVVSAVVTVLEAVAARCALPALFYLSEVTEDGAVLAGVELELPAAGGAAGPRREFFWSVVWHGSLDAYDQAAVQAIRFLQSIYGFVVRDYNYDCMVAYRNCLRSALVIASSAACRLARSEREALRPFSAATVESAGPDLPLPSPADHMPLDWQLLCSQLMLSYRCL
jgi:hypothetical protein